MARMVVMAHEYVRLGVMRHSDEMQLRLCTRSWLWRKRNAMMRSMTAVPSTAFVSRSCSARCVDFVCELERMAAKDPYASSYVVEYVESGQGCRTSHVMVRYTDDGHVRERCVEANHFLEHHELLQHTSHCAATLTAMSVAIQFQ